MPDPLEQIDRALARLLAIQTEVELQRLHQLVADGVDRVERGHRVLKDHRDVVAPDPPHLRVGELDQVLRRLAVC